MLAVTATNSRTSHKKIQAQVRMAAEKYFTDEFPNHNYQPTTNSEHPQSKYWPRYLPVSADRLFIIERSKNAQLIIYTARFQDREKQVYDKKSPIDINWYSFGWTENPVSNGTGMIERRLAWGYTHKAVKKVTNGSSGSRDALEPQFELSLNALSSRKAHLCFEATVNEPMVQIEINGINSRLRKVFVCATDTQAVFIPKVAYVELYGTSLMNGEDTYEKILT
uniref:Uncharacterized protein AlNc14C193G8497 n=1 Tax=Albugo laibachii Nc14 TaxID=890382 RepID=F0WQ15_9STRA|nr:conserved hypothetical protein [Albugo laibachii Nc14]|eukprot:CCA23420.1 conserved hypothetical protein [Albugo laibachii Nc14]